jgi:dTDP-4-amino-4,6-dideoxygalactose transaminase
MEIKRYDYSKQFGDNPSSLFLELRDMILDGRYISTKEVEEFENQFSAFLGVKHAYGTNSGTDALIIALTSLGIKPGDEVITQANTFYSTVAAIKHVGATPKLVDVTQDNFSMDAGMLENLITDRTKVILPVHLYGKPADMDAIIHIANNHNLLIIEDAAQAHGAMYKGKKVGTFGEIGCFSFHPSKNLAAAGDGGCIVTNDSTLFERIRCIGKLGQIEQNRHILLGLNSKLDSIQARILSWKLPYLETWNMDRNMVARSYKERLNKHPIQFQGTSENEFHVYHLFQIRVKKRDELLNYLQGHGIDATIRYPFPIHLQEAFENEGWYNGQFPVAEQLSNELLCLPIRPEMSEVEIEYVCRKITAFFKKET